MYIVKAKKVPSTVDHYYIRIYKSKKTFLGTVKLKLVYCTSWNNGFKADINKNSFLGLGFRNYGELNNFADFKARIKYALDKWHKWEEENGVEKPEILEYEHKKYKSMREVKIYTRGEIQTVYKQFNVNPKSVVYSNDNGMTWQSPPMDTGKWALSEEVNGELVDWVFAFLK